MVLHVIITIIIIIITIMVALYIDVRKLARSRSLASPGWAANLRLGVRTETFRRF